MPESGEKNFILLELAIRRIIERQKYLKEYGSFSPNDDWILDFLQRVLDAYEQSITDIDAINALIDYRK